MYLKSMNIEDKIRAGQKIANNFYSVIQNLFKKKKNKNIKIATYWAIYMCT